MTSRPKSNSQRPHPYRLLKGSDSPTKMGHGLPHLVSCEHGSSSGPDIVRLLWAELDGPEDDWAYDGDTSSSVKASLAKSSFQILVRKTQNKFPSTNFL